MDGILKALIALACMVVIAIGAYFGYSEYERIQAERDLAVKLDQQKNEEVQRQIKETEARDALFEKVGADKTQIEMVRTYCRYLVEAVKSGNASNADAASVAQNCQNLGYAE